MKKIIYWFMLTVAVLVIAMFAMNGQTGRLVGELPVSRGRFWALFAAIAVPLSVLSSVLFTLL